MNLTTIIIQRITHAFDRTFDYAFDESNVCGSHANAGTQERLNPDVTSMWRGGGREGGREVGRRKVGRGWRRGRGKWRGRGRDYDIVVL